VLVLLLRTWPTQTRFNSYLQRATEMWQWLVAIGISLLITYYIWLYIFWQVQKKRYALLVRNYRPSKTSPWADKTWLVLVNPFGGQRRGLYIYEQILQPMCAKAGIRLELMVTERARHAFELMHDIDLSGQQAVVCISGDGMMHEVINGLVSRVTSKSGYDSAYLAELRFVFQRVALGLVPGGTSNGIATSITNSDPFLAIQQLIDSPARPIDLFSLSASELFVGSNVQCTLAPMFDVLGMNWGLPSEFNEMMERRLRSCPLFVRTTLPPPLLILSRPVFAGTLRFLPVALSDVDRVVSHYTDWRKLPLAKRKTDSSMAADEAWREI